MKNKKWMQKTGMAILAGAMVMSMLTGCGGDGKARTDRTEGESQTKTGQEQEENSGAQAGGDLKTIRIMGIDNTGTDDSGNTVYLSDWVNGDSKLWGQLTSDLADRGLQLELDLIPFDQYETVIQTQIAAQLDCDFVNLHELDTRTKSNLISQGKLWRFAVDAALPLAEIEEDFSHATEEEGQTQQALWESLEDAFSRIHAAYLESNETKGLGRELVAYVDAHYTEAELSQQDIADAFGISRPVVSRVFKETTQMNFVDYLRKRRVEQACFCFNMGEKNVMEAARKSGYVDELTFRRAFMRCVGMTPKDYVKKWNDKTRKE